MKTAAHYQHNGLPSGEVVKYNPQEMEALPHPNGFRIVQHYSNWTKQPPAADSPRMIQVCRVL
ncbi:MAG: hypothetical protein U0694_08400 [Anaerolineae bacterium]